MEINPYALAPATSLVVHIALLAYLLYKSKSARIQFYFSLLFVCVILWAGAETVMKMMPVTSENYKSVWYYPYALACGRLMGESVIGMIISGLLLSFQYPIKKISDKKFKILAALLFLVFLFYSYFALFTPLIVSDVLYYWAGYGTDNGPLFTYSIPLLILIFIVIFYNFSHSYIHAKSKVEKMQLQYMTVGALIFTVGVSITGLPNLPPIYGLPTGNFWIIFLDIFWLYAAVKYKLFTIEAVLENGVGQGKIQPPEIDIAPGDLVLVSTRTGRKGFEAFRYLASKMPGLCITTKHPSIVRAEYGFTNVPIIWISEITTKERALEPNKLDFEISYHIYAFLREGERRVIYIDNLDYLATLNGFERTYEFCKGMADEGAKRDSVILFSIAENAYSEKERSYFESIQSKKIVEEIELAMPLSEFHIRKGMAHLLKISSSQRENVKSKIDVRPLLAITSNFPVKFQKGFKNLSEIRCIWITETSGYENGLSARKMEFEVSQEIIEFVKENAGKGIVYIDAVPVFLLSNGFLAVLKFLKDVCDECHEHGISLVVEIPPKLFEEREMALVEHFFDYIFKEDTEK